MLQVPQLERRGPKQKTNTFQIVIASDEIRSYVMLNYEKIDWISSDDRVIAPSNDDNLFYYNGLCFRIV